MPKVPRTPPPDRLDALPPDVHVLPAGSTVWRIYFRGGRHPTRWNRFRRVGPTDARFDHQLERPGKDRERAVLYTAGDPVTRPHRCGMMGPEPQAGDSAAHG